MMKLLVILLLFCNLFAQEGIEQLIENVQLGKIEASLSALPELQQNYPNHAGVMYLAALLETDGDKARVQYQQLYKNHPNSEYSDDAVMKIAEYYYAAGLYIKSSEWTKRMARYYARSEHIDRAVKLFLNALIISGSKDTAFYYSKVFKKQFPKMDVDTKLSQLLNELEIAPTEESKVEVEKPKTGGILDKIVETLSAPVPEEIELPMPTFPSKKAVVKQPFSLQVGAYGEASNADHQKSQLDAVGYPARVELKESNGRTLYIVKIGYYSDRMMAKAAGRELKSTLSIDTIVVANK
ncbi:MAG: SPOR domain-containing protein [Candidatus Marinimicrobia bacterium]|nr:SPOR domain-containing protein [Candidatus Neomarinimicrobiota bacterium]